MSTTTKKKGRPVSQESRDFNVAIYRLMEGKCGPGGIADQIAILTGLTIDAVKWRSKDVMYRYPPNEVETPEVLDTEDHAYLNRLYADSDDPAVQEFLANYTQGERPRPDSVDPRDSRVRVRRSRRGIPQPSVN